MTLNPPGLSEVEAQHRLETYGPNRLHETKSEPFWEDFLEEVREPLILLLLGAGVLYALWGEFADAATIFFVILTLNTIEVVNERRAKKAITALRQLAEPTAAVIRDGLRREIQTEQVVPGDALVLQAGRRIPADARLIEAYGLAVDESTLTGESVPVEKEAGFEPATGTSLAEQRSRVHAGTLATRGRGLAEVTATGMQTELGRIAGLTRQVKEPRTPLQQAMSELSRLLVWLALGFSLVIPLLGWLVAGQPLRQMLLTGLSLAFATIPEELPIIITMVLALGGYRLSKHGAIVKRLQAVETLGAVTVIATDKTGTLTENRVQVARLEPPTESARLLELGVLCSDAVPAPDGFTGDPLETALLRAAAREGVEVETLRQSFPLLDDFTFDNTRKRMSTVRGRGSERWVIVKGAPEAVLAVSSHCRVVNGEELLDTAGCRALLDKVARIAAEGLRVIALAEKCLPAGAKRLTEAETESGLTFAGLVGMADPPRPEARAAILACRQAGIRPILVTGDHPLTAAAIAHQVELEANGQILTGPELDALSDIELKETIASVSIYARTTPEHKLRLVRLLQSQGDRVAVTGDGTNDAPALAAADIGVAMGEKGSDVAREAADVVLADDNFATIVNAIGEGRALFENLKKGVRYYLAVKVALVSTTLLPVLLQAPVPFAPVQIILMELFMDLAAAAAFVAEPAEGDVLKTPPRDPRARFMDRPMILSIVVPGLGLFAAVAFVYLSAWYGGEGLVKAQTMAFSAWLAGHVLMAFNLRSTRQPLFKLGLLSNRLMLVWGAATLVFVLAVTNVPALQTLLKVTGLTPRDWLRIAGAAVIGTFWLEGWKWFYSKQEK